MVNYLFHNILITKKMSDERKISILVPIYKRIKKIFKAIHITTELN